MTWANLSSVLRRQHWIAAVARHSIIMACVLLLAGLALGDEFSHVYEEGEAVVVWFSKVSFKVSRWNSQALDSVPLCYGASSQDVHPLTVGEVFEGFEMRNSHMNVSFLREIERQPLCSVQLSTEDSLQLSEAVNKQFWLQMFVDDLPAWGQLGQKEGESLVFVYTHFQLLMHHCKNQIVQVLYQPQDPIKLEGTEQSLNFSYSVTWLPTSSAFETRLSLYKDPVFFQAFWHWYFMLPIVVLGMAFALVFKWIINRLLYNELVELPEVRNTTGEPDFFHAAFKQLSGDAFRAPRYVLLLAVCVGVGTQLLAATLSMLILVIFYPVYLERTHLMSMLVMLYSLCAVLNGLRSGSFYIQQRGRYWKSVMLMSLLCVPMLVGSVVFTSHMYSPAFPCLGWAEGLIFLSIGVPLHMAGTVLGRKYLADPKYPCKISLVQPRRRYKKKWLLEHPLAITFPFNLMLSTLLLFTIKELFSNIWNCKLYCSHGLGLAMLMLLSVISAFTAIGGTWYQFSIEDYHWPWASFLSAGSVAGHLFLHITIAYSSQVQLSGWLPWSLFFGYMGLIFICLFLLFGTVGHLAVYMFLRHVYAHIKRL